MRDAYIKACLVYSFHFYLCVLKSWDLSMAVSEVVASPPQPDTRKRPRISDVDEDTDVGDIDGTTGVSKMLVAETHHGHGGHYKHGGHHIDRRMQAPDPMHRQYKFQVLCSENYAFLTPPASGTITNPISNNLTGPVAVLYNLSSLAYLAPSEDEIEAEYNYFFINGATGPNNWGNTGLYQTWDVFQKPSNTASTGNWQTIPWSSVGVSKYQTSLVTRTLGAQVTSCLQTARPTANPAALPLIRDIIPWETQHYKLHCKIRIQNGAINVAPGDNVLVRCIVFRSHIPVWNGFLPSAWNGPANFDGTAAKAKKGVQTLCDSNLNCPELLASPTYLWQSPPSGTKVTWPLVWDYNASGANMDPSSLVNLLTGSRIWGGLPVGGNVFFQQDPFNDIIAGATDVESHMPAASTVTTMDDFLTPYLGWPMKRQFYVVHDRMITLNNDTPSKDISFEFEDKCQADRNVIYPDALRLLTQYTTGLNIATPTAYTTTPVWHLYNPNYVAKGTFGGSYDYLNPYADFTEMPNHPELYMLLMYGQSGGLANFDNGCLSLIDVDCMLHL